MMILICLFVLHLGATKMHTIQTGWQKNLHTSFLTKHSLLNSRYRSSVKIISVTLVVWWTIQWLTLVHTCTCQYHTYLIFTLSHFFNKVHVYMFAKIRAIALCATFLFGTTFWHCLWAITELVHSTMESINFVNNIHEKLLDSDWLRAVQYKCNTPVQKV